MSQILNLADNEMFDKPPFVYKPTASGYALHESDKFIKIIVGPYGSGKSCAVVNDLLYYAYAQRPASNGIRYTRIGVIRGSYPMLSSTTRKSIIEVAPPDCGSVNLGGAPMSGTYSIPLADGTTAQIEFVLQALETAEDAEKIRSANWSFAWINEATEVDYAILAMATTRVGRFPTASLGGCTYAGIIIDCNQPPRGHFLADMIKNPEPNWEIIYHVS